MRCSCVSTRAARLSGVSSGITGTAAWMTAGPASSSGTTKWTVQPCSRTPSASARAWVSRPRNAGRRDGWMLSIRPVQRSTNQGVSTRMKPARQTISMSAARRVSSNTRSKASRSLPKGLWSTTAVAMPASAAAASPAASGRLDTTSAIVAGKAGSAAAAISAVMLEPRPEMSTATRFRGWIGQVVTARVVPSSSPARHPRPPGRPRRAGRPSRRPRRDAGRPCRRPSRR